MAIFKIGFLFVAFFVAKIQGLHGFGGYGLSLRPSGMSTLFRGLAIGLLFFLLPFFLSIFLNFEYIIDTDTAHHAIRQFPVILLMTFVPSLAEDILTRGYLFGHFKFLKPSVWVLISTIIYVLNHIWRLDDGAAVLSYLTFLGIALAIAVLNAQSLWLAFGIHWGANIAYEVSNAFIHTKQIAQHDGATWLLAASWCILAIILGIYRRSYLVARSEQTTHRSPKVIKK